jgi:2-oxoglutarate ferredoxin oxidoreductase subunit alpha
MDPAELEKSVRERFARYETVKENETRCEEYMTDDAEIVLVAYGIAARVCKTAIAAARKKGIKVGLLRPITLWPYPSAALAALADSAKAFLCVELNMGQMTDDVKVAIECRRPVHFYGRTGGMIPSTGEVLAEIEKIAGGLK